MDYFLFSEKILECLKALILQKGKSLFIDEVFDVQMPNFEGGVTFELDRKLEKLLLEVLNLEDDQGSSKIFLASLPTYIFSASGENLEEVLPLSAGLHLLIVAAHLFDSLQDRDKDLPIFKHVSEAELLNVALTLLGLGYEVFIETLGKLNNSKISATYPTLVKQLSRIITLANRGQLLDLHERQINPETLLSSTHYSLNKAALKTAFITSYLTGIGACLAGTEQEQLQAYKDFGFELGIAWHILGDLSDFEAGLFDYRKSRDFSQWHLTVPLVFAYQGLSDDSDRKQFLDYWEGKTVDGIKLKGFSYAIPQTLFLVAEYLDRARQALKRVDPKLEKKEHQIILNVLQKKLQRFQPYLFGCLTG